MLFVNAGVSRFAPFEATPEAMYDEVLAVNTKGPYFTVQKLAPLLAEGSGVVLTTSAANVKGLPMISAYSASKAALRSMTRTLARELLPRGVRVNAISDSHASVDTATDRHGSRGAQMVQTCMTSRTLAKWSP
jgi:NAD(P)-dependent dehydrogenase (short-subunit alcohol dehydrogenase family)